VEVTLNLNRALKEAQKKRKNLEAKKKERKRVVHATDDVPKKPARRIKSEIVKLTIKELQREIDREAQALNDANRDANLKEMAVKLNKMGPEIHAAYVKDKRDLENLAADVKSSAGNTPAVRRIPLKRDVVLVKEEGGAGGSKDPRINRGDAPKAEQFLAEVHYDPKDVESDSADEEEEFHRAEAERVQINLPEEAYAVPYADVAHIILPFLMAGDPEGNGYESEDDLMIIIDTEVEEQARVEKTQSSTRGSRRSRGTWRNLARRLVSFHFHPLHSSSLVGGRGG